MKNIELQEIKPDQKPTPGPRKVTHEFFVNDVQQNIKNYRHRDNSIDTKKYNIITFLPKALLFQFFRLANVYFLFIAIIQSIPIISPLGKETAWGPLAFVLTVSLIREAFEDLARYKYDKILNSEAVTIFRNGSWVDGKSGDLKIGEIVLVRDESCLPADMILLDSSNKEGMAFIETGTLDGEKTLKQKISPKETAGFFNNEGDYSKNFNLKGRASSDLPNPELYKLDCKLFLEITDFQNTNISYDIPCDAKQLLLKGAILKNSAWVIGFVVYTGHYNKIILNSKKPRMKYSRVETLMSKLLIFILFLQFCFCIICAALNKVYYQNNIEKNPFMPKYIYGSVVDPLLSYFTYILLLNTMIPISLIISLEIAKMIQGYFLISDALGYSHTRKKFIKASTVSLNEELGQVNFIFSDKTGTLTCNKMEYKYGVIGDVCYEYVRNPDDLKPDSNNEKRILKEEDVVKVGREYFSPKKYASRGNSKYPGVIIQSDRNPNVFVNLENESTIVAEYWKALSICHQCDFEEKDGKLEISGLSPDDIELVKTAAAQGYECQKPPSSVTRVVTIGGVNKEFEILNVLEFDSDRKRMSIIVRDDNIIKLYIKGADTAIEWINSKEKISRLSINCNKNFKSQAKHYVDHFSNKGYRTLLVGMRVIDDNEYEEWSKKLHEANMQQENKKKAVDAANDDIEKNVYIIGSTIVEDKLQDKVEDTIRDLRLASIKIWMLTGDKIDTAYNIGLCCNLISKDLRTFRLHGEKGDKMNKLYDEYSQFRKSCPDDPFAILIDAVLLSFILESDETIKKFLDIAYHAASVICCRVSPLQKSDVVRIMKNYDPNAVTLSIGDGGNDVSMILEAHIGN
jgi:phospholipid-transporting ATPase